MSHYGWTYLPGYHRWAARHLPPRDSRAATPQNTPVEKPRPGGVAPLQLILGDKLRPHDKIEKVESFRFPHNCGSASSTKHPTFATS
ncbi:hypothetical protein CSOJ01_02517 [Colletotrichum sojae]|uniref:Uncharacterized protein n=1 Tax=Colletotrichum sojae TaxID=2175907 RepID=A0A8H6JR88_9PEZI|nr:hypothetical protein CSOJ01_02517 [Colletotrichum sojae]